MPIYEYECEACGTTFEVMHSVNSDGPEACETADCKGTPRRKISASGFILKGSGWYATDYPSEARKKGWEQESQAANPAAAPAGDSGTPAPAAAPAAPAESKPAAPKESSMTRAANKNPYSGGKKKVSKSTGKKSK